MSFHRKKNMNFKVVIFTLSLSTTLGIHSFWDFIFIFCKELFFYCSFFFSVAYPLQNESRGAAWADTKTNQAHDKADQTKDME